MSGRSRVAIAFAISALVTGCASLLGESPPITYYALTSTSSGSSASPLNDSRIIAVQTVRLPEYLNQKGIVTRTEANELNVAANSQWAGTLDDNITKVIVADLSKLLGTSRIVAYPVSAALPVDRVVQVDVSRFEAESGGNVELSAQWIIFGDGGRQDAEQQPAAECLATIKRIRNNQSQQCDEKIGGGTADRQQTGKVRSRLLFV